MQNVLDILEEKEDINYKPTDVKKQIELKYDLGHLMAYDPNPLNLKELRSNSGKYLNELSRDNCQLIINKLWALETTKIDNTVVAKLPKPETILPRAKRLPSARAPTKWEQFARTKGIRKKKKEKLAWDDQSKEWKPTYGYRGAKSEKNDWLIEIPESIKDPNVDMFKKKREEKQERVAKNELQRLKNVARSKKQKQKQK